MIFAFRIFLLRCASGAVCEAHRLVGWSIGRFFHSFIFFCYVRQRYKCFFNYMQIFCLFFLIFFWCPENKPLTIFQSRAESPFYFSPIPQGWGIDSPVLFFEGCKPELICQHSANSQTNSTPQHFNISTPAGHYFSMVCQLSANSQNNSTSQQSNNSTPERHHFSLLL